MIHNNIVGVFFRLTKTAPPYILATMINNVKAAMIALNQRGSLTPEAVKQYEAILKENNMTQTTVRSTAALKAAGLLKSRKAGKPAAATKTQTGKAAPAKKSEKTKGGVRKGSKATQYYARVAKMWNENKSSSEISDALGLTDKKSAWPYSYVLGLIKRLKQGVEVDGKKIQIKARK